MHDMQRYLVGEFAEEYLEGEMSRRDLLRRVLLVTGSAAAAATALSALGVGSKRVEAAAPPRAHKRAAGGAAEAGEPVSPKANDNGTTSPPAQTADNVVDPDDPAIQAEMVSFGGAAGEIIGYLAQPAAFGLYPGMIVVHENRGLIEPNKDIARRYAKEGYVALAVDLVSRAGGTDKYLDDLMQATGFLGRATPDDLVADLMSGLRWLGDQETVDGLRMGATGFCFGGGMVWRLAEAAGSSLRAAVPFYGPNPPLEEVPSIEAAILGIYAELDTRITGSSAQLDTALDAAGKTHAKWIAPGANHAFFNNTSGSYHPAAAMEAWPRALAWFRQYLGQ